LLAEEEDPPPAATSPSVAQSAVTDVGAVYDEDDGMAAGVVALPELAQAELAADVPEFEVHVGEDDGGNVLADGGHGFEVGRWAIGVEDGFDLLVEGGFTGVVEAEEEDRVFCERAHAVLAERW
jgi:hypothetical protein